MLGSPQKTDRLGSDGASSAANNKQVVKVGKLPMRLATANVSEEEELVKIEV